MTFLKSGRTSKKAFNKPRLASLDGLPTFASELRELRLMTLYLVKVLVDVKTLALHKEISFVASADKLN